MHVGTQHLATNENWERRKLLPQLGVYHIAANPLGPRRCRIRLLLRLYQCTLAAAELGRISP